MPSLEGKRENTCVLPPRWLASHPPAHGRLCGSCERSPCFSSLGAVPEVQKLLSPLLCFLLSWEITELRVCLLVMRPEYIGIICRHQLINSRIKGKKLAEGDACQIFAEQRPLSAWGRRVQLGCAPCAIKLNCLTLLPLPPPQPQKARV